MSRAAYEIRALGSVPPKILEDFQGVSVSADPVGTTIHADLADEAELHGLLDALRREGFELVDIHREPVYDFRPASTLAEDPEGPPLADGGSPGAS